jgi:hypothetical protein
MCELNNVQTNTGRIHERVQHGNKPTANSHLPQMLENGFPIGTVCRLGQKRQPLALPRKVTNAGGGLVVEGQLGEFGIVQDAGNEVACGSDSELVATLYNSA